MSRKHPLGKYAVSTLLATSVAFSPMMASGAFAHGGPSANVNANKSIEIDATENTDAGTPILSQGDQGQEVTDLQQKLQNHGYDLKADGIYGATTQEKIVSFQNSQGWNPDGVVDAPTLNALNNQTSVQKNDTTKENSSNNHATKSDSNEESDAAILSQGDQGSDVADLQTKLQNQGYDLNTDGVYGPTTQEKVIAFQNDQGWNADGVFDAPTSNALNNAPAETQDTNTDVDKSKVGSVNISGDTKTVARSLVGKPYVWGGTDPNVGFDSSGFINYVFEQQDVALSRTHAGMWANDGVEVDSPSVGDVVFFEGTYKSGVSHSGIYIGNNQMIHAGDESSGVEITTPEAWEYYWSNHYIGAKRF